MIDILENKDTNFIDIVSIVIFSIGLILMDLKIEKVKLRSTVYKFKIFIQIAGNDLLIGDGRDTKAMNYKPTTNL
jgi:hypothetical protein